MTVSPTANVFSHNIGTGLSRHLEIVSQCLAHAQFRTSVHDIPPRARGARLAAWTRHLRRRSDASTINLFLQDLVPTWFHRARTNLFLPNQEWFAPSELRLFPAVDHVICASQHAADLFSFRGPRILNLGFTSLDRFAPEYQENRTGILHVAGRSPYKGTRVLVDIWARHPEWPTLTMVHAEGVIPVLSLSNVKQTIGRVTEAELLRLQNESWLHIIPTEAEAFGHSLCEAMSVGALVITSDAPPMNELVRCDRGILVACNARIPLNMGHRFFVDPEQLEVEIGTVLANGPHSYTTQMRNARRWYVENDARVRNELAAFFRSIL